MENRNDIELIEVFVGINWQAEMLKNLLENANIKALIKDEISGSLNFPWDSSGGLGSVKVVVSHLDYDKAILIAKEYQENIEDKK